LIPALRGEPVFRAGRSRVVVIRIQARRHRQQVLYRDRPLRGIVVREGAVLREQAGDLRLEAESWRPTAHG
jgi:hypothetical protein